MNLFRFIPGYESAVYDAGKEPMLFLFIAFIVAFALTRLYTRLARKRGWGSGNMGGVHIHHMVPGIVLMVVCGVLGYSTVTENEVAYELTAIGFGAGAALTLDEFAMIFHLKDVYWAQEGRTSIDAMLMGVALAGLCLVVTAPFGSRADEGAPAFFVSIAVNLLFATVIFLKKKPFFGVIAIFLPFFFWIPAFRLAKPGSPWAHWFYDPDRGRPSRRAKRQRKLERSVRRFEEGRFGRFERWFSDLIGGAPSLSSEATGD